MGLYYGRLKTKILFVFPNILTSFPGYCNHHVGKKTRNISKDK